MGESSAVTKSLRFFLIVVIGLTIVFLFISLWQKFKASRQRADSLAINHLQFVEYEGGPVNALAYQPGDDLYLNFDVQALPLNDQHRADAEVDIQPLDADGKAMVRPVQIPLEESASEKHIPFHMTLPLYALGGRDVIKVTVQDRVHGQKADQSAVFQINGPHIAADASFGIQDHAFVDHEGGPALADAAYHPGSMIRSRLNVVGFRKSDQNHVKLFVDVAVLSDAPQPIWEQSNVVAIDQDFFYPPMYIPITTAIFAPSDMAPGAYRLRYTLHDEVAGQTISLEEPFQLR